MFERMFLEMAKRGAQAEVELKRVDETLDEIDRVGGDAPHRALDRCVRIKFVASVSQQAEDEIAKLKNLLKFEKENGSLLSKEIWQAEAEVKELKEINKNANKIIGNISSELGERIKKEKARWVQAEARIKELEDKVG